MKDDLNVYDKKLEPCSTQGMAKTGYTREGSCFTLPNDRGRHHICIDLQNAKGFCPSTGQNWCDDEDPCDADPSKKCGIKNWCVCEWAFARYVENNVGPLEDCPKIQCDAVNKKVIQHYKEHLEEPGVSKALDCIIKSCHLPKTTHSHVTDS